MEVFDHLDKNKDGYLDYAEFCQLSEEKRRGIDPFDFSGAKQTQPYFSQGRKLSNTVEHSHLNTVENKPPIFIN